MTRDLLLSIKPQFADAILSGSKTIEVRRRFPLLPSGTRIWLYSSSPLKAVVGVVRLTSTLTEAPTTVWVRFRNEISIEEATLAAYLEGAPTATLLVVSQPERFSCAIELPALRAVAGLEPSQSYRYLNVGQVATLEALSGLATRQTSS